MGDDNTADDELEIRLLGPTIVRRRNGDLVEPKEWRTGKSLELVRSLALSPDVPVPADILFERLWPGVEHAKAQGSLRNAMHHVRRVLGEDSVERRSDGLLLCNAWTDVRAYACLVDQIEEAHRAGHHARVAKLCRESEALYVRDIELDGSGEWVVAAQLQWRELRLRALLASSESASQLRCVREALDLAEAALELDITSERATRVRMRAFGALGETREAMAAYERLRTVLAESYGIDPSPQTRALHLELLTSMSGVAPNGSTARDVLVGQTHAVEALTAVFLHVAGRAEEAARSGVVWLIGEPGSGRETVARAASRRAHLDPCSTGVPPLRIPELLTDPPKLADGQLLLSPAVDMVSANEVALLSSWAALSGTLLVVPAREMTVAARAQALDEKRMLVAPIVQVDPLAPAHVRDLLAHLLQAAPAPSLVDAVVSRTSSRAGHICTTVRHWLHDGRIILTPQGMALRGRPEGGIAFPPRRGLLRSLGALDARALETLAVVAAAGDAVPASQVDRVLAGLDGDHPQDAQALLDQLTDSGTLRVTTDGYRLRTEHDRATILAWLRPARRRRVHSALTRLAPDPVQRLVDRHEHRHEVVDALVKACWHGHYDHARELVDRLSRDRPAPILAPMKALAALDFAAALVMIA